MPSWRDVPITYTWADGTVARDLGLVNATPADFLAVFVQPCVDGVRFEGPDAPRLSQAFDSLSAGELVDLIARQAGLHVLDDGDVVRLVERSTP